ncbi:MAG: NAD(+) synthase, partial [Fibrobacterota bacterium]
FELASYMNEHIYNDQVIPDSLIPDKNFDFVMPPSAELKTNQVDPMKWGYHDVLVQKFTDYNRLSPETVLEWYNNNVLCEKLEISQSLFNKYNLGNRGIFINDLEWLVKNIQRAVFKRIQAPPIIILSKGAYGYDVRESQLPAINTSMYNAMKNK